MNNAASLQARLLGPALAGMALLWVIAAATVWFDVRHEVDELLDSHLAQAAALLVARQAGELEAEDDDAQVSAEAPALHRYASAVAFQVWHEGRLLLRSPNAPMQPMSARAAGFETRRIGEASWRVFSARGAERDILVQVGERIDSRHAIVWAVSRSLLWPLLITLPLLGAMLWWLVRRGLAPLRALGEMLRARAPEALQPVALARVPAEIEPLIGALNQLFGRIARLLEQERRFTADAAHELRTPIAAIRAQAEVALGAERMADAAGRAHALHGVLAGCDRAAHLVEQLLVLARLEADGEHVAQPLPLAPLLRRVLAELAPLARGQDQTLSFEAAPEQAAILAQEALVAALARNLVDNALRYSGPSAQVQVGLTELAGRVELSVQDSGPGLDEPSLARLGERFFRVAGSEASGSGLGWSIVRRIAAVQGATVHAERSTALGGLKVSVRWPRAAA